MAEKPRQKAKSKLTNKEQSERFKQTARELGVENSDNFAAVLKKIARIKKKVSS
jgi:hypothetical protein